MKSFFTENPALLKKAKKAVALAQEWLDAHEAEIAAFTDLNAHYKACYLYAVTGNALKARQYADFMAAHIQKNGDFRTKPDEKGWYTLPCSPANRYVYPNGWIVAGLQKMGAYGTAAHGLDFLLSMQDSDSGGFYSRYVVSEERPDKNYVDTSGTASAGLAMLACGRRREAVAAGEFTLEVIDAQPEPEKYYFSSWLTGRGLQTDVFGDDDQTSLHGRKQFCLALKEDPAGELVWLLGKPMKFLCKLYDLTGDERCLHGARKLFDQFERMGEAKYDNLAACKIMWGGAELYRHTGDRRVGQVAGRILEAICDGQDPSGAWLHRLWYKNLEEQSFAMTLDCVQEMYLEITDVMFDL